MRGFWTKGVGVRGWGVGVKGWGWGWGVWEVGRVQRREVGVKGLRAGELRGGSRRTSRGTHHGAV